jgi:hypothetical protein
MHGCLDVWRWGVGCSVVVALLYIDISTTSTGSTSICMHGGGRDQWGSGEGDWDI